jgi:hypothetical protein
LAPSNGIMLIKARAYRGKIAHERARAEKVGGFRGVYPGSVAAQEISLAQGIVRFAAPAVRPDAAQGW